jgi:adenine-specific DNA-methyltransferase
MSAPMTPLRTLWYMGAKTRLCEEFIDGAVRDLIAPGATILDACSGTGAVGRWFAGDYRVFANDAQEFSAVIARAHLEVSEKWAEELDCMEPESDLAESRDRNVQSLEELFGAALQREDDLLGQLLAEGDVESGVLSDYRQFCSLAPIPFQNPETGLEDDPYQGIRQRLPELLQERRQSSAAVPAVMCSAYWSQVYFGIRQSIRIDSIRQAIEEIPQETPFAAEKKSIYLAALLHAVSVSTSGTSHFAQPRSVEKDKELIAVAKRRSIDIEEQFELALDAIRREVLERPRLSGNRVFCSDVLQLLAEEGELGSEKIDLVYLDPPYTTDNYSRFYHVLETLARYDYPELQCRGEELTKGRYPLREERFTSDFCSGSQVENAFRKVAEDCVRRGAHLLISYSGDTGLLTKKWTREGHDQPVAHLRDLLLEYFSSVEVREQKLMHSGQGDTNKAVQEILLLCEV